MTGLDEQAIVDTDAAKRVGAAINAMRTSKDEKKRLLAVRDCSRTLDPVEHQDAIEHLAATEPFNRYPEMLAAFKEQEHIGD